MGRLEPRTVGGTSTPTVQGSGRPTQSFDL